MIFKNMIACDAIIKELDSVSRTPIRVQNSDSINQGTRGIENQGIRESEELEN